MTIETQRWHPSASLFARSIRAGGNVLLTPIKPGSVESVAASGFAALLCDLDISNLDNKQRKALFGFVDESLYFNGQLDSLAGRERNGRDSLLFTEEFYCFPQHLETWRQEAREAGYKDGVLGVVEDYYDCNRILNYASSQLISTGSIDWSRYQIPEGNGSENNYEREMIARVRSAFDNWEDKSLVQKATLFRAFSSIGYAVPLTTLMKGEVTNNTIEGRGMIGRIGSLVMCNQAIDDFWSPSKDIDQGSAGITRTSLTNPDVGITRVRIGADDTRRAVEISRQIIGGCIDKIEPSSSNKLAVAKAGTVALAAGMFVVIQSRHKGSNYDPSALASVVLQELSMPSVRDSEYRQSTREAIEIAVNSLTSIE